MDGFGDNFDQADIDPAAEFLKREQDQLAGLEDDLNSIGAPPPLDNDSFVQPNSAGSFEMINDMGQSDGLDFGAIDSDRAGSPIDAGYGDNTEHETATPVKVIREEPEKIKKWREEQKNQLTEKDANEEKRKSEMREAAKKELEDWYTHHEQLIAKTKTANRNAEKLFVAETEDIVPGTEWERIAKLCDFNPKSSKTNKDVSRMRSIILQLKQAPPSTPIKG